MNERIAKLANESGFDVDKSGVFGNYSEMHRIEKLAELLIKETLQVARAGVQFGPSMEEAVNTYFGIK